MQANIHADTDKQANIHAGTDKQRLLTLTCGRTDIEKTRVEEDDGAGMQTHRQKQGEWGADSSWRVLADRLRRACRVPKPVLAGCSACRLSGLLHLSS